MAAEQAKQWPKASDFVAVVQVKKARASRELHVHVICPDFPLDLTRFLAGKHLIHFLANKMQDFQNFYITMFSFLTLNRFT